MIMVIAAIASLQVASILILHPVVAINSGQTLLGGGAMGTPFAPLDTRLREQGQQNAYLPKALVYLALFLGTQWLFLCPRGGWRIRLSTEGPPPFKSALAAGFIGMLLSIGLLATLMEIPNWWLALTTESGINSPQHFGVIWIVILLMWGFWGIVFHRYWRSLDRYTALRRVIRWLIAGTILEMVIAVPTHAIILYNRGSDCYCERGTYTGVAFGCTAAFWLFGPGVFLLFLREKVRSQSLPIGQSPGDQRDRSQA